MNTYIATFHTHFGAMSLQRALKKRGIAAEMMPVPRALSASCGVCVRFTEDTPDVAKNATDLEAVYWEMDGSHQKLFSAE